MEIEVNVVYPQEVSLSIDTFTLQLQEKGGERVVPVLVYTNDAKFILLEMNKISLPRPLSYDLFMSLMAHTQTTLQKVIVYDFHDGIFLTRIELFGPQGPFHIESRLSDAVLLALKANAPIFFEETVFHRTSRTQKGRPLPTDDDSAPDHFDLGDDDTIPLDLTMATTRQLNQLLKRAEETENFELAAEVQEEIKRRENDNGE